HLDGSTQPPMRFIPGDKEGLLQVNPEYTSWQGQDQLLASWLISSLFESILISVIGMNTSFQIWNNLESSLSTQSKARTMHYKIQLQNLKKGNLNIREYVNQVKMYCDTLAAGGHTITEQDQIMHVDMGYYILKDQPVRRTGLEGHTMKESSQVRRRSSKITCRPVKQSTNPSLDQTNDRAILSTSAGRTSRGLNAQQIGLVTGACKSFQLNSRRIFTPCAGGHVSRMYWVIAITTSDSSQRLAPPLTCAR
ncbi:Unknown protein, partial [Striga hermonthica]